MWFAKAAAGSKACAERCSELFQNPNVLALALAFERKADELLGAIHLLAFSSPGLYSFCTVLRWDKWLEWLEWLDARM